VTPVKVLVVDDSALVRQLLTDILARDPEVQVVGTAGDPYAAWDKIQRLSPDVLTLDVEMPRMDGLTFLEKLMRARPTPVVMVSSLTEKGAATTLRALELGAFDFVAKPKLDVARGTVELGSEIVEKVKAAARCGARANARPRPAAARGASPPPAALRARATSTVIAVGASTGGTEALRDVLTALPADAPGVVVVQHMPEQFTRQFAERLAARCRVQVKEAADGDAVLRGHVLIARGNWHMELTGNTTRCTVKLSSSPPIRHHRPSVDVLFRSCARVLGGNAVGVVMTGMGADGAQGLLEMRRAGARTIAQDEASSVVFGMPKEAIALGGAEIVAPLDRIADTMLRLAG
jgi:two-component system chemotaxis response regulator CheB